MLIEPKFTIKEIKQGVKGITPELLKNLINNPGWTFHTRRAMWYAEQIEPPYNMFNIYRCCINDIEHGFSLYGIYIDERGLDEEIIIHLDEVKL